MIDMRKISIVSAIIVLCILSSVSAFSQSFIDTDRAERFLTLGVRAGVTNSNVSPNYGEIFSDVSMVAGDWGTGFNIGIVADLNIRKYFSIQPGFFFSNQSYDTDITSVSMATDLISAVHRHARYYYFQIPVLASFKFNLVRHIQLVGEIGPYISFGLGGNCKVYEMTNIGSSTGAALESDKYKHSYFGDGTMKSVQMKKFDFGWKMGIGLKFAKRYSIMAHYMAGTENIARPNREYESKSKAYNKEWVFSVGFDF